MTSSKPSLRDYAQSIILYGFVGGCAALVEWSIFFAGIKLLELPYLGAALAGFCVATWVNWLLSRNVAFVRRDETAKADLYMVYFASAIALGVNLALMSGLIELAEVNVMAAKITGTGAGFFLNYIARQFFIYSSKPVTLSEGADRARHMLAADDAESSENGTTK